MIRIVDKLDRIGIEGVGVVLRDCGLSAEQVRACSDLAQVRGTDAAVVDDVSRMGVGSPLLHQGPEEPPSSWSRSRICRPATSSRTCRSPGASTTTPARSTKDG